MKVVAVVICALAFTLIPDAALQGIFDVGFEAAKSISEMIMNAASNVIG